MYMPFAGDTQYMFITTEKKCRKAKRKVNATGKNLWSHMLQSFKAYGIIRKLNWNS